MYSRGPRPSPTVPHSPLPSHLVPYPRLFYIVGPVVLLNDGRSESSKTRTDHILPSLLVRGSWQLLCRSLQGPWTVENTALDPLPTSTATPPGLLVLVRAHRTSVLRC
ncbi:hypothetical protein L873DRAFT_519026 [Choiromyces venosus 120613-1]|uniref:Uncharacterized protein n=1 Tax=Choiromyces venosus 120613-1 TaxID=1336337 RepID=A0A3N4KI97_9PEZI|nr:hypothetical protein L873DRAFT_519026 [Choiromyces venosus 120613-1]